MEGETPPPRVVLEEGAGSGARYDVTAASVARAAGGSRDAVTRGSSRGRSTATARPRDSFLIAAVAENRAREIGKNYRRCTDAASEAL